MPDADRGGGARGGREVGPGGRDRRLERGPRRPHRRGGRPRWARSQCTAWRSARPPGGARRGGRADPRPRRARLSGVGRAHVRHLRRAAARPARGGAAAGGACGPRAARAEARLRRWAWTTGCGSGSAGSAGGWSRRRCRAAPACSPRSCAPTGCSSCPPTLEGHHAGEEVTVRLLRGVGEIERTIVATGSHDLVLDLAASSLRERDPLVTLASSNVGSLGGLTALRDGLCHLAGSHLLDPDTRRVHAAVLGAAASRPRRRGRAARSPGSGADRRAGQPDEYDWH